LSWFTVLTLLVCHLLILFDILMQSFAGGSTEGAHKGSSGTEQNDADHDGNRPQSNSGRLAI